VSRGLWRKLKRLESRIEGISFKVPPIPGDPLSFCDVLLGFKPTSYQRRLLESDSKRIVVRWARQSGKTTALATLSVIRAVTVPRSTVLIISPGLRQSMILGDRIRGLLESLPGEYRVLVRQMLKTIFRFRNRSTIIILPNSEHQLRGFTADLIVADEAAFFHNDDAIFDNILPPMLATTDGTLVVSSTPWGRNIVYYRLNQDPGYEKHVVTWEAYDEGVYHPGFLEHIERQRESNPQAYRMEYLAEFAEEADTWLTQDLLTKCCSETLAYYSFDSRRRGRFYAGIDLAERVDHSVIAVLERTEVLRLVHMHRFKKGTSLASVIGYAKLLSERWDRIHATYIDSTKHGDYIVEDMKGAGVANPKGIFFTVKSKQEMAQILRQRMSGGGLRIPYDRDLLDELNVENYQLTKTGRITYSHPDGAHDDRFWALALAVYAAEQLQPMSGPIACTGWLTHLKGA
jgi:phage FluMu gp28-like protein